MTTTLLTQPGLFERALYLIDVSELPLEAVANVEKFRDHRFQPQLYHPDFWHDGRWVERA